MKKLLAFLFSIFISFNSYGGWEFFAEHNNGTKLYLNKDTIREHDGYVYYWILGDYLVPPVDPYMSTTFYVQGDCGTMRHKDLTFIHHHQPMGNGESDRDTEYKPIWEYATPDSLNYDFLDYVCDYVK